MMKKLVLLAAILLQIGLVSATPAAADDPDPQCFPCAM
jgi:hypothetical protein